MFDAVAHDHHAGWRRADVCAVRDDALGQAQGVEVVGAAQAGHAFILLDERGVGRQDALHVAVLVFPPVRVLFRLVLFDKLSLHGTEGASVGQLHGGFDVIGARLERGQLYDVLQVVLGHLGDTPRCDRLVYGF